MSSPDDRPPGARSAALRILARVEAGAWSDRILAARQRDLPEARERHFLQLLVLTTLRWQLAADARLAPHVRPGLRRIRPLARAALRMGLVDALVLARPAPIAVDATLEALRACGEPRAVGLVNAVLRRVLREDGEELAARDSVPAWLWERWRREHGEQGAETLVAALNRPGRGFVYARPDRGGRDVAARRLAGEGVETEPSSRLACGLVITGGSLASTTAFREGDVVPLNEASALVAALARAGVDGPAADLAAAPGGKGACLCQRSDHVVLMERDPGRVRLLAGNLSRWAPAGVSRVVHSDASRPPLAGGEFAVVLVDAPCSGTGTLRRRPEIRHRLEPGAIAGCARVQGEILEAAAELPRPGGVLVYAVCSLEPEEGPARVRAFLERHPGFEATDPAAVLGDACRDLVTSGDPPMLRSRPESGGQDGFFAARLVRRRTPRAGILRGQDPPGPRGDA